MARVGFEESFYEVDEAVETVEICAALFQPNVTCPIEFNFSVTFETRDETAGTYICICVYSYGNIHLHVSSMLCN